MKPTPLLYALALLCFGLLGNRVQADPLDQWTPRSGPVPKPEWFGFSGIAFGNDRFVAIGGGNAGTILTSVDGATWTRSDTGTSNALGPIAYGAKQFVVCSAGDAITSQDGVTWTLHRGAGVFSGATIFVNDHFVSVGDGLGTILTSADGVTWSKTTQQRLAMEVLGLAYGANTFVAVGSWDVIATSPSGTNWTLQPWGSGHDTIHSVAYGNGQFVAVGDGWPSDVILSSPDGRTWTSRASGLQDIYYAVAFGRKQFVAVGSDRAGDRSAIVTSSDGIHWTRHDPGTSAVLYRVAYGHNSFVAVGGNGTVLQSGNLAPAPPSLGPVDVLPTGAVQVSLSGQAGQTYPIQASTNLTDWLPLFDVALTTTNGQFLDTAATNYLQRFYRAVAP